MHLSEKEVMKCDPNAHSQKAANVDWIYADRVTGMPFVRQLLVNTHIMSILLQRNSNNVHRGILSGNGHTLPARRGYAQVHCHAHLLR